MVLRLLLMVAVGWRVESMLDARGSRAHATTVRTVAVGQAITLTGATGARIQATLTQLTDPANSAEAVTIPGMHLVAAEFTLTNQGIAPFSPDPVVDVRAEDGSGHQLGVAVSPGPAGGAFLDTSTQIPAGQSATGQVLFEVPDGTKVAQVRFSTDGVTSSAGASGIWKV